jgi:hypothetical protein
MFPKPSTDASCVNKLSPAPKAEIEKSKNIRLVQKRFMKSSN